MELKIFIVLFCALFTGGHSLQCYQCSGMMGYCVDKETTCQGTARCASTSSVELTGGKEVKKQSKGCEVKETCVSGSTNFGVKRTVKKCCSTNLCNSEDAPDYNFNSPNGKQCYYCDERSCFNRLNCSRDEDHCAKATVSVGHTSVTAKGCVSKSFCDLIPQANTDYTSFSCCQGNLCNGAKSVTQNLIFLFWPLFFYILIH